MRVGVGRNVRVDVVDMVDVGINVREGVGFPGFSAD